MKYGKELKIMDGNYLKMETDKIIQPSLNTPKRYLFSITKVAEEMEEDCAIYTVNIYQRTKLEGFPDYIHPRDIGGFDVAYIGNWNTFFENLKQGIEKRIHVHYLEDWTKNN